jgi:hypothetical protein
MVIDVFFEITLCYNAITYYLKREKTEGQKEKPIRGEEQCLKGQ